jgi:NAD(P)-dependent dehydrogenase (short-subunit alcohol dehydrogenase family)
MPESSAAHLSGKICLITGATGGIGKQTALKLAQMGAVVVIVGRNPQKTARVVEEIKKKTKNPDVEYLTGDLSLQSEVRRVATEFLQRHDKLQVLVNNVGLYFAQRRETREGIERTLALNHLCPFLLTNLLEPALKAAAPARVVNVSSGAHVGATLDLDDLQNRKSYHGFSVYSQSKLMNIYFTYELARRLQGSGVTANCLHPGFVATHFGMNNGFLYALFFRIGMVFAISPQKGAQTSVYLASSPQVKDVSGKYFYNRHAVDSSWISYNAEIASRLWEVSCQLSGISGQ